MLSRDSSRRSIVSQTTVQSRKTMNSNRDDSLRVTSSKTSVRVESSDGLESFDSWRSKTSVKPDDQLDLTEAELSEEITKILTQESKKVVDNLVIYSFKDGEYLPILPDEEDTATLFAFEGTAIYKDLDFTDDEGEIYESTEDESLYEFIIPNFDDDDEDEEQEKVLETIGEIESEIEGEIERVIDYEIEIGGEEEQKSIIVEEKQKDENEQEGENEQDENEQEGENEQATETVEPEGEEDISTQPSETKKRKLINQFNFCERATLTLPSPQRSVETQTNPPPRSSFGGNVLQWIIYDSYTEDYARQLKAKEKDKKGLTQKKDDYFKQTFYKQQEIDGLTRKYLQTCQVIERMINQNIFDEIAQDYRYYEDPADEFRDGEGTLLPLWKFTHEKTKRMSITDICFNLCYYDLFAVTYGSFDFMKQNSEGGVCLFTIKNPSFPDYNMMVDCGVMCCDIHPQYPYLLAIGMYDGNVSVYNLQNYSNKPIYVSRGISGKHSECVMEIKWGPNMSDGEVNFYSVSIDGRVFNWVLMQNKLSITTIITLYLERTPISGSDGTLIKLKGCGSCMTFHPTEPEIFLVGTEEGYIYKCNTAFSSKYLMIYEAHFLSIYRIDYNKFNSNIFISCSGDWRVKIWEDMRSDPLFVFDLGSCVGDVKWAPYSSTVFAAVTSEGKVFVFDLNVNKYKPLCIQPIVPKRRNKLRRLAFNQKLPFIIVGDEKGTTISLKLSPNLRLQVKPSKKQQNVDQYDLQVQKLEKLLSLVRELPEGEEIKDSLTATSN